MSNLGGWGGRGETAVSNAQLEAHRASREEIRRSARRGCPEITYKHASCGLQHNTGMKCSKDDARYPDSISCSSAEDTSEPSLLHDPQRCTCEDPSWVRQLPWQASGLGEPECNAEASPFLERDSPASGIESIYQGQWASAVTALSTQTYLTS